MLVDSHAHLGASAFNKDRDAILERAREAGVIYIINVSTDLATFRDSFKLGERYPEVFLTGGFHPHDASQMKDSDLTALAEHARKNKVVAIGEIGLDFYRNLSPREKQLAVFRKQLELARELGMPVVLHCRQAHQEMLALLVQEKEWCGVIHCFGGDSALARSYLELGFFISLSGSITYSSSNWEMVRTLPSERLLVETDSPYLAPQPYRHRRNEPSYLSATVEKVAQIRGVSPQELADQTVQNARQLFELPKLEGGKP